MLEAYLGEYFVTRLVFQRCLAGIYFVAFSVAVTQFIPLCGEKGLLPVSEFLKERRFWDAPSLLWLSTSDRFVLSLAWAGVVLSLFAVSGFSERFGLAVSALTWLAMWILYMSFVNTGQTFYGFGWETLLLEAGFLAIFLGSADVKPPVIVIWLYRWLLFRLMFGAGLIKIRGDECWRDLTCMFYHYQTQPMPNPLSWFFHRLPVPIHKFSVLFNHFVELVVPLAYFVPGIAGWLAGGITIAFHTLLIVSGNFSWLNFLSLALCVPCFDDRFFALLGMHAPQTEMVSQLTASVHQGVTFALALTVTWLSIAPTRNLFSPGQLMNASFDSLHLVNTYGAFGSITRERNEIVIEGSASPTPEEDSDWLEYEFRGKPGDVQYMPRQFAPYHLRLDWLMWFAAMGSYGHYYWFVPLMEKLLEGDKKVLGLLRKNPFPDKPPAVIRAMLYRYEYTSWDEWRLTGAWWRRKKLGLYFAEMSPGEPPRLKTRFIRKRRL